MALANLNINVNANVSNVVNAMADVKAVANASMLQSSEAVSKFQRDFERTGAAVNGKSQAMGADMQRASEAIAVASNVTTDSLGSIESSANATFDAMKGLSEGVEQAGKKVQDAMGPQSSEQIKNTTQRMEEFIGTRIAIAAIGVALGAMAATIATVGYAAYKASGFLVGLFTGSSYKSENIDALIAANKEVKSLQDSLQMAAYDAAALNDALNRLGVDKSNITDVYEKVTSVTRGGKTDELDRLGVAYKDVNGKLLDTYTIVENAKRVLDEYTDGWDRNQAAAALGLGSYEQLNNYLTVNQQQLQKSKSRLNEYNLAIGPETQKFVSEYQQAMREFDNELKLMGEGMKRVWADQVMPAYTTFANAFKDGWPSIVNGTRHVMAAFTSLGYGLKMVFDIAYDVLEGIFKALGGGFGAIAAAVEQVMRGNFDAAKAVLIAGWQDAKNQISGIGGQIVRDAQANLKAMQLAQGQFNKDMSPAGGPGSGKSGSKKYRPPTDAEGTEASTDALDQYIRAWNQLQDEIRQLNPYMSDYDRELQKVNDRYDTFIAKFPQYSSELETNRKVYLSWVAAKKEHADALKLMSDMYQLELQDQEKAAQAMSDVYQEILMEQQEIYRTSPWGGMKAALDDYAKAAQNMGDQVKSFTTSIFRSMETALTDFIMKGKLDFKSLADSIISDMVRITIQQQVTGPLAKAVGSIDWGAMFGGGKATGGAVAYGTTYLVGENGPELFTAGANGAITPNHALSGGAPSVTVNVINQSGQPVNAKQDSAGPRFDGKAWVTNIILQDMAENGPLRTAMAMR